MSSSSILMTVSRIFTTGLAFVLEVALLVVALTVVRNRRADAGALLAASAGLNLVLTIVSPIAYSLFGRIGSGSSYLEMSVFLQLGFSVFHAVAAVLLILGVVRLATEPSSSASPY